MTLGTAKKGTDTKNRVWIELENADDEYINMERAMLANRWLGFDDEGTKGGFWWDDVKGCFCFTVDEAGGFWELSDPGYWFDLNYLAKKAQSI